MIDHPLWDYFDYKKAAINVLQDYGIQATLAEQGDPHAQILRDDLTHTPSPRFDGAPGGGNPKAGENRIVHILDHIDALERRRKRADAYLDWFNPAWNLLSEDERFVLECFFLDGLSSEDAALKVGEHFYIERASAFQKKNRALTKFARALYGRA